ncbi:MAG TPA: NAD(P)/FAD-dependent oxidoreductase [Ferruginibacter sp.]|nr:NAD(P)/FAD-dependent oxidoreductase [Ferruginibacter sp.]HMP21456.1 NAD(P)/FAD-dependent oxidoreductase [Ferruginibacter sp.]
MQNDFDAVVVGSGPNGLAAAITLQQQGLSVLLIESKNTIGGGLRTQEITLPGFKHDVCSAIHPLAAGSPFFRSLPLHQYGLQYISPPIAAAHPFDDGTAAFLHRDIVRTASQLGVDEKKYLALIEPLVKKWPLIDKDVLAPLSIPRHPMLLAGFGIHALKPASSIAAGFSTSKAKGLWAGMAAHAIQPFSNLSSAAIGLVLLSVAHLYNWPISKGGSQQIANALQAYFISLGGKVQTGMHIAALEQLPASKAVLLDVTPAQLLQIAGYRLSGVYKWQLKRYRYGMGVFKIDWALDAAPPFLAESCRQAGTIHIGNSYKEIAASESETAKGKYVNKPFVLFAQQSLFDDTRAPAGKHTAWAYCHVPNGSVRDMTEAIEQQVERFAPGFRDRILARHSFNTEQLEAYNNNYIGGDINGGIIDIRQLFTRPALRRSPYRTSLKGLYICSSSTPPGGGVHGMCGHHAALRALKDIFKIKPSYI